MRRVPNPWIAIPSLLMGALAAALGWAVTDVSCRQADLDGLVSACLGWSALVAVASFVGVTVGVGILLVLVYRSLAEWRHRGH